MSQSILDTALGVGIGILSTIFFFLLFGRILNPKIQFSQNVRISWNESRGRFRYNIRMKKSGFFDLIETKIHCRFAVRDVRKKGSKLWNFYLIPTTFSEAILIENQARLVDLKIHESNLEDPDFDTYVNEHVEKAYPRHPIRFEDVFSEYAECYVQIFIIGHDSFSGFKRLYRSPKYYFHTFREGEWVDMDLTKGCNTTHSKHKRETQQCPST